MCVDRREKEREKERGEWERTQDKELTRIESTLHISWYSTTKQ
jgi:hypothetical protein